MLSGCGGGSAPAAGPQPVQSSSVRVLVTSTANDRLSRYTVALAGLTLTNQSGLAADVFTTSHGH
jgi:hypothetical protein